MEFSRGPAVRTAVTSAVGGGPAFSMMSRGPASAASAIDPNRIYSEVMSPNPEEPQSKPPPSPLEAQAWSGVLTATGTSKVSFPPLGRVPLYNPAHDTRENFEQHTERLNALLEELRRKGAYEHEILAFRLQRQAELEQMFPKQGLRQRAESDWKATARLLKDQGVAPAEIRKYLKSKAMGNLLPTPFEVKTFIESRKQFAVRIAQISREAGGPAPQKPSANGLVRGQVTPQSNLRPELPKTVDPSAKKATQPVNKAEFQPRGMMRPLVLHKL